MYRLRDGTFVGTDAERTGNNFVSGDKFIVTPDNSLWQLDGVTWRQLGSIPSSVASLDVTGALTAGSLSVSGTSTVSSLTASGTVSGTFTGDGSGVTNLDGANLQTGTIGYSAIETGYAVPVGDVSLYLPLEYAGNNTASLIGHKGQVPTTATGSIVGFEGGKFDGGTTSLTEGFTNFITNPSFEVDTSGWVVISSDSTATITIDTTKLTIGNASMRIDAGTSNWANAYIDMPLADGETLSASADIYSETGISRLALYNASTLRAQTLGTVTGAFERVYVSYTNNTGATETIRVRVMCNSVADSATIVYVDAVQATKTSYQLPYRDGTMQGCSWTGTAHASTTTVTASRLEYASDVLFATAGTIAAWVKPSFLDSSTRQIIYHSDGISSEISIKLSNNGTSFRARVGTLAYNYGTVTVGSWQHIALTWDNGTAAFYIDGVQAGSWSYSGAVVNASNPLSIFSTAGGAANHASGEICGVIIKKTELSASTIKAISDSGVPVRIDSNHTTYDDRYYTESEVDALLTTATGSGRIKWLATPVVHSTYNGTTGSYTSATIAMSGFVTTEVDVTTVAGAIIEVSNAGGTCDLISFTDSTGTDDYGRVYKHTYGTTVVQQGTITTKVFSGNIYSSVALFGGALFPVFVKLKLLGVIL